MINWVPLHTPQDDEKAKHHKHKHGEDEKEKVEGDKHAGGAREEKLAPGGAPAAAPTPVRVQGVYVAPTPMAPLRKPIDSLDLPSACVKLPDFLLVCPCGFLNGIIFIVGGMKDA